MDTITETQPESKAAALRRLLVVAKESGVRLGVDRAGDFWATSVSEPGRLYAVSPESCGCRGFATHRRCRHVAALWSHLGYFDPAPTPPAPATCTRCNGRGDVHDTELFRGRYVDIWLHCHVCQGSGHIAAA